MSKSRSKLSNKETQDILETEKVKNKVTGEVKSLQKVIKSIGVKGLLASKRYVHVANENVLKNKGYSEKAIGRILSQQGNGGLSRLISDYQKRPSKPGIVKPGRAGDKFAQSYKDFLESLIDTKYDFEPPANTAERRKAMKHCTKCIARKMQENSKVKAKIYNPISMSTLENLKEKDPFLLNNALVLENNWNGGMKHIAYTQEEIDEFRSKLPPKYLLNSNYQNHVQRVPQIARYARQLNNTRDGEAIWEIRLPTQNNTYTSPMTRKKVHKTRIVPLKTILEKDPTMHRVSEILKRKQKTREKR